MNVYIDKLFLYAMYFNRIVSALNIPEAKSM